MGKCKETGIFRLYVRLILCLAIGLLTPAPTPQNQAQAGVLISPENPDHNLAEVSEKINELLRRSLYSGVNDEMIRRKGKVHSDELFSLQLKFMQNKSFLEKSAQIEIENLEDKEQVQEANNKVKVLNGLIKYYFHVAFQIEQVRAINKWPIDLKDDWERYDLKITPSKHFRRFWLATASEYIDAELKGSERFRVEVQLDDNQQFESVTFKLNERLIGPVYELSMAQNIDGMYLLGHFISAEMLYDNYLSAHYLLDEKPKELAEIPKKLRSWYKPLHYKKWLWQRRNHLKTQIKIRTEVGRATNKALGDLANAEQQFLHPDFVFDILVELNQTDEVLGLDPNKEQEKNIIETDKRYFKLFRILKDIEMYEVKEYVNAILKSKKYQVPLKIPDQADDISSLFTQTYLDTFTRSFDVTGRLSESEVQAVHQLIKKRSDTFRELFHQRLLIHLPNMNYTADTEQSVAKKNFIKELMDDSKRIEKEFEVNTSTVDLPIYHHVTKAKRQKEIPNYNEALDQKLARIISKPSYSESMAEYLDSLSYELIDFRNKDNQMPMAEDYKIFDGNNKLNYTELKKAANELIFSDLPDTSALEASPEGLNGIIKSGLDLATYEKESQLLSLIEAGKHYKFYQVQFGIRPGMNTSLVAPQVKDMNLTKEELKQYIEQLKIKTISNYPILSLEFLVKTDGKLVRGSHHQDLALWKILASEKYDETEKKDFIENALKKTQINAIKSLKDITGLRAYTYSDDLDKRGKRIPVISENFKTILMGSYSLANRIRAHSNYAEEYEEFVNRYGKSSTQRQMWDDFVGTIVHKGFMLLIGFQVVRWLMAYQKIFKNLQNVAAVWYQFERATFGLKGIHRFNQVAMAFLAADISLKITDATALQSEKVRKTQMFLSSPGAEGFFKYDDLLEVQKRADEKTMEIVKELGMLAVFIVGFALVGKVVMGYMPRRNMTEVNTKLDRYLDDLGFHKDFVPEFTDAELMLQRDLRLKEIIDSKMIPPMKTWALARVEKSYHGLNTLINKQQKHWARAGRRLSEDFKTIGMKEPTFNFSEINEAFAAMKSRNEAGGFNVYEWKFIVDSYEKIYKAVEPYTAAMEYKSVTRIAHGSSLKGSTPNQNRRMRSFYYKTWYGPQGEVGSNLAKGDFSYSSARASSQFESFVQARDPRAAMKGDYFGEAGYRKSGDRQKPLKSQDSRFEYEDFPQGKFEHIGDAKFKRLRNNPDSFDPKIDSYELHVNRPFHAPKSWEKDLLAIGEAFSDTQLTKTQIFRLIKSNPRIAKQQLKELHAIYRGYGYDPIQVKQIYKEIFPWWDQPWWLR